MAKWLPTLACAATALLGPPAAVAAATPQPAIGDFLETSYMAALAKTHSPRQAAAPDEQRGAPQLVMVSFSGDTRQFATIQNWQAGSLLLAIKRDGTLQRGLTWGHTPDIAIKLQDKNHFCLVNRGRYTACYNWVGNAQHYINGATLGGTYIDRQDKLFAFNADGNAHFPGFNFHYAVILDQPGTTADLFEVKETNSQIAFRHTNGYLELFAVTPNRPQTTPIAILRPRGWHRLLALGG